MRVLFYSGGLAGSGHIVLGLALAAALRRRGGGLEQEYSILTVTNDFVHLAELEGVALQQIPAEDAHALGPLHYRSSALYKAIMAAAPDILVVDMHWFAIDAFIDSLPCRKVVLFRQVDPAFFAIDVLGRSLRFRPESYDLVLATEPGFTLPFAATTIEPLIIRNRDEILSCADARAELGLAASARTCLFPFNGHSWEGADAWKSFSYLEDEGWTVFRSYNRQGGLFPAVHWFNAFDMLVCGAGYSAFWEARYFDKEAFFVPFKRNFENQPARIAAGSDYIPSANGADQLVNMLLSLGV